jgi:hypothetical protein
VATTPKLFQSPFDVMTSEEEDKGLLPGQQATKPVESPEIKANTAPSEAAPAPAPEPVRASRRPAKTERYLPPSDLRPMFDTAAQKYDVPVNVIMALAHQESRYNSKAIGQETEWGRAKGMMQNLDATAKGLGINPFDPEQAIDAASKQIRERLDKGYSMIDAVREHFAGPDRKKWGKKTEAYGNEVMEKVGKIGAMLFGADDPDGQARAPAAAAPDLQQELDAEEPGRYRVMSEDDVAKYEQSQVVLPGLGAPPAASGINPKERTWGEALGDTGVQLAEGVNTILGAVPSLVAPESKAAAFFDDNAKAWRDKQSTDLKARSAKASAAIDKAGEDGVMAQISEAASQYFSDPGLAARFVVTNLPSMIPGIGAAKLAQAAALARGAAAAKAAAVATTAAGGVNAVLNGGGARGEAFNDIKRTLIAQGKSEAEAEEAAIKDSRVVAAVGAVTGFVSGKTGLEGALAGSAARNVGKAAAVRAGAAGALTELAGEQLEEVAPKLTANYQASEYDGRSLGKDVGRTVVETGIASGPGAAIAGGAAGINAAARLTPEQEVAAEINRQVDEVNFVGQDAAVRAAMDPNNESVDPASTRKPAPEAPPSAPAPAPSQAAGPLSRAAENTAAQADQPTRVTITTPDGEVAGAGALQAFQENEVGGFNAQIVGDDGQVYNLSDQDGVQITPEAKADAGPLSRSVTVAADQHAAAPAMPNQNALAEIEATKPKPPPAPPGPPNYSDMDLPALRERLKYIAQQAKASGGMNKMFLDHRKAVEKAINAKVSEAKEASKLSEEPLTSGPFDDRAAANKMALRTAEKTGVPQEVVEAKGKFNLKPMQEAGDAVPPTAEGRDLPAPAMPNDQQPVAAIPADEPGAGSAVPVLDAGAKPNALKKPRKQKDKTNDGTATPVSGMGNERSDGAAPAAQDGQDQQGGRAGDRDPVAGAQADTGSADPAAGPGVPDAGATNDGKPALKVKDAHAGKWFSTEEKARAYLTKSKAGTTHRVEQTGRVRFEVKPKDGKTGADKMAEAKVRIERQESEVAKAQANIDARKAAKAAPASEIDAAANEAATSPTNDLPEPTQAQAEAGNYKKGKISVHGLDISVENPRGSTRSGTDPDGKAWSHTMSDHYGYIKRTTGADNEQVDVYVGPKPESDKVYVVDQIDQPTGKFDEHKIMMGYASRQAAVSAYKSNFDKGWKVGPVKGMSVDEFKAWLKEGDTTKPAAETAPANEKVPDVAPIEQQASAGGDPVATAGGSRPAPVAKPKKLTGKASAAERARQLADYFAPGNIVKGYGGHDRIISFAQDDQGGITVEAQHVIKKDGEWIVAPGTDGRVRKHATMPGPGEFKAGPVMRAQKEAPAEQVAAPIADFGQKLEGARKDLWAGFKISMREALPENVKDITLAKHFPEPNYEALLAEGVDVKILAAMKAMRDEIPAKPRVPYKAKRWGEQVSALRDFANDLLDGKLTADALLAKMRQFNQGSLRKFADRIEMYADLGYPLFTKAKGYSIEKNHYNMFRGETPPGGITKFELSADGRSSYFDNRDDAVAALREKLGAATATGPKTVKLDLYRTTGSRDIIIGKKVGAGKYIDLKGGFTDVRSARTYLAENQVELEKLLEQKKDVRPERRSVNDPRVGVDRRKGEDVTPEKFGTTFGFRGVQFGNYVEQKRRAVDLNNAYDALLDLADLLGLPPQALSLNGTLGLAFGARGAGGKNAAAAHFEPDNIVINLTKTNGAGSLAHEWFHGFDNYFERMRGAKGAGHVTDRPEVRKIADADRKLVDDDSVRPEVLAAVKGVMDAIRASGMPKRSRDLDARRSKDYWSTTHELAARAFESYIIDKAAEQGLANDYMANIVSEEAHNVLDEMAGSAEPFPYPTRAEAPAINAAFDKLFEVVETRDEGGRPVMYSVSGASDLSGPAERRLVKALEEAEFWLKVNGKTADLSQFEPNVAVSMLDEMMGFGTENFSDKAKEQGRAIWDRVSAAQKQMYRVGRMANGIGAELLPAPITPVEPAPLATLSAVREAWDSAGIKNSISERNGIISLSLIVVPMDARNQGIGKNAMRQLIEHADKYRKKIVLTPSDDFGGNKSRLIKFYKGFGFTENKGKNKDYEVSESMYRMPNVGKKMMFSVTDDSATTAIAGLMSAKEGEAVINRPDVGDITVMYGEDGKSGLSHIAKRRGTEFIDRLPALLRDGKVYEKEGQKGRIFIGNDRDEAVIRLDRDGKTQNWLLSAYEKYPDLQDAVPRQSQAAARAASPLNKASLRKAVTSKGVLGHVIASMIDSNVVVLHDGPGSLPKGAGKNIKGVQALTMPDGSIHLIASNLTDQNAQAVMLHEAFHQGAEKLIGTAEWGKLMGRMGSLYRQGEQSTGKAREFFDKARARVAAAKGKGAIATRMEVEEFAAYAIEEYESAPLTVRKWVDDLIGLVKAWLVARFGKQLGPVTPAQLSAFAKVAIMDAAYRRRGDIFGPIGEVFSVGEERTIEVDGVRRPITNSKGQQIAPEFAQQQAFWNWFGGSAVTDADGKPLVVYHGTGADIDTFKVSDTGTYGGGIYLTPDLNGANDYAMYRGAPSSTVYPLYVSIKNPATGSEAAQVASWKGEENARAELIKRGYDGVVDMLSGEIVAFNPEQIKSATGNEGTFNPDSADIRYSVAADVGATVDTPAEPAGLTPPEQGLLRRVQSQIQDNMNRLKQVQERILELTGLESLGKSDYYGAETNRPGRIAARMEDGQNYLFGPLMERLAKAGHTMDQLGELLHAQHAKERNERVASINPAMPDGGSGMTTAQAGEILKKYEGDGFKSLHRLAEAARNIARATLDLKLAYGLIKSEDHEALTEMYEAYVPLKGDGEYGPKIKRAMGHEERDEMILDNISRDYNQAVTVGEKNLARQSLLRMVLQFPHSKLWTVGVPPKGRYVAGKVYNIVHRGATVGSFTSRSQVDAFLEAKGAQAGQYEVLDSNGDRVAEFVKPLQDNEVMVYLKGDPIRIQIFDEKLAAQLRPLKGDQLHPILGFMRSVNQYLSKIYTGYNPAFILRNAARDLMTGSINMMGNQGTLTAAKAWGNYPKAWATMLKWAATKKIPDGQAGNYLNEYRQHGGKVGASWLSDIEQQGKTLERMYDDAYGVRGYVKDGRVGKATWIASRKMVGGMAHVVEVLNQAFENALRLSLFMALRQDGQSPALAAQAAKGVTVDFDRKGTSTPALGAIYLFFNPAVQGTANGIKTIVKGKHKEQAWAALGGLAALGYLAAAMGMDDDEDRWLGESWEVRAKNFMLTVGGHQIRVPLSQEFAPIYAFGASMAEASRGQSKPLAAAHVVSSFIDAYFPLHGAVRVESDNHALDLGMATVPTAIKPFMESAVNRNTFGSQIVPESVNTKDRPDNLKMTRAVKNGAYDRAAQGIASAGEMMGAGTYENDITKVSPETLKHYWRTYTGGLGQFVGDVAGLGIMLADDPTQANSSDVPFVKDFYKTNDVKPIRGRFYDLSRDAKAAITEFEQAKKAGNNDAMDAILNDEAKSDLVSLGRMVRNTTKAATAVRDEEVDINGRKDLSPAEKRAALKALEQDEEALYRSGIEAFK